MRPRFTDQEMNFLLEVLEEVETKKNRQILNFQEEQQHIQHSIFALRQRLMSDPYHVHVLLKHEKDKLTELDQWLPIWNRQAVVLHGLIVRMKKILAHKRGRIPYTSFFYDVYLRELCTKKHEKPIVPLTH